MREITEAKVISRVRRKRNFGKAAGMLLVVFLLQFAAVEGIIVYNGRSDEIARTDYLLILGAGIDGEELSLSLRSRLEAALKYLREYPDVQVVVTGGQGRRENIPEAEAMRRFLVENGISEGRIIVEPSSTSTMENFKLSAEMIRQRTGQPVSEITFITNDFHILRAKMLAGRNGLKARAISCDTPHHVAAWMYTREYFALIKSFLLDR